MADAVNDASMSEDFTNDYSSNDGFTKGNSGNENGSGDNGDRNGSENNTKEDDRKLFVGGLSGESSEKDLREYFNQYGDLESVSVKTDPNTGRSRRFAFLVFTDISSIDKVLSKPEHIINGKKVDPKKAKARQSKIFVGGLKPELSDDDIRNHFSTFGTIVEMEMPQDRVKNQRKNFCFITFEEERVVQDLVRSGRTSIGDVEVDVKKATPKPSDALRGGMRGGAVMRGRGTGRGTMWAGGWQGYGGYPGYPGYGYGYDPYGYGMDYYGGYGAYGGGYDGYAGYGGYGMYGGDASSNGGKHRGGARGTSRHQPY